MMRWPYVSREFLASAEARAKAERENAMALRHALVREEARADQERAERIAERDAAERRYQALLDRVINPMAVVSQPFPAVEREAPDENEAAINKVIREQSDGDHARARELRKYARELKNQGKTADEIIAALVETWSTESVAPLH